MLRPVDTTPKPPDERREDQHGIVHICTYEPRSDIRLGSTKYWWATYPCGCYLVTSSVLKPVNCLACLTAKGPTHHDVLETLIAQRQGA